MRLGILAAVAAALFAVAAQAQPVGPPPQALAAASPPSLDDFYTPAAFDHAQLSPDGRFIAFVQVAKDANDLPVSIVVVQRLEDSSAKAIFRVGVKGSSINWLEWKDNDRLLLGVEISDTKRRGDKHNAEIVSVKYGQFIIALDRDGKNERQLLTREGFLNGETATIASLLDRLKDDPDHILAIADGDVWKVDIRTGQFFKVESGSMNVFGWLTDSKGDVVVRYRHLDGANVIEARAPDKKEWTKVADIKAREFKSLDDFEFLGATEKPAQFYVTAAETGSQDENRRLRTYDIATHTLSAPIWPDTGHDIESVVYQGETQRLAGVCYRADLFTCAFADKVIESNYRGLVKYFHGSRSVMPREVTGDRRWWLLNVSGPDEPGAYYLFDAQTAHISHLAERFPRLPTDRLAERSAYAYTARDGVNIPAYLSRPRFAGPGPLPLIVMPHGGPEARDDLNFDTWSQILATRGYLVLQPNFRGSSGYGERFQAAGYRQWGGVMADDITDGVRQLIASKQVDPTRICIFGASYGGYAALYAGAKHPELYKCVVSWAGVSDLPRVLDFENDAYGRDSLVYRNDRKIIGDPGKDLAAMRAASPKTYAPTYQPPVLLIHGEADWNVHVEQSQVMYGALKSAGHKATLLVYKDEGHPEWEPANQKDAFAEVIRFIESCIAPAEATSKTP